MIESLYFVRDGNDLKQKHDQAQDLYYQTAAWLESNGIDLG